MQAYLHHLEQLASENNDFRRVLYTTTLLQVCVMCLKPREESGSKLHDADHFYLVVQGGGSAIVEGVESALSAGSGLLSPAGREHNIVNTGRVAMKLCEVVAPPHYRQGAVHGSRGDAEADEDPFEIGCDAQAPSCEAQANWMLGLLALHGMGLPLDLGQASRRFERASQLGHPLAAAGLAWCAISDATSTSRAAVARAWLTVLEPASPARSLYLQWAIDQRLESTRIGHPADGARPGTAADKLVRAAKAGDTQALLEMGLRSAQTGRPAHALDYFRRAAVRSPAAAVNVAMMRQYLQERDQPLHQLISALQRDPTPLYDLLPARWRLIGPVVAPRAERTNQGAAP